MKGPASLVAILAVCAADSSETLTVKRLGGTGPVAVELARENSEPEAAAASRFVELSHSVHGQIQAPDGDCLEEGCTLTEESSELLKNLKKKLQKRAKKLKKQIKNAEKEYLETHTEEEYEVLKNESILESLERENSAKGEEAPQ